MPPEPYDKIPSTAFSPEEQSLLDYHRGNLHGGSYYKDPETGRITTINIMGITGPDGRIYNVPGYFGDGKMLEGDERNNAAKDYAELIGWSEFPSYGTGAEANSAAQTMHGAIESDMNTWPGGSR